MQAKPYRVVGSVAWLCAVLVSATWGQQSVADELIAKGHYRRALPLVRATLDKRPRDVEALIALSTIQWSFGQLDASLGSAEKAVAVADDSALTHAQLVNALGAKLASNKTTTFEKLSLSHRFHKESERTLQLDPNNVYALEATSRFYWYAPGLAGGDRPKALLMIKRLIQVDAVRGYALKAEFDASDANKTKRLAAVRSDWEQAVVAEPESYRAHAGLGGCLMANGGDNLAPAELEAKRALDIDTSRIAAYKLLASLHVATAQWKELEAVVKRAQSAVPDDLSAEYAAAEAILEENVGSQWQRAEQYLRHYLSRPVEGLAPTWAMAHWKLGLILERQGRKADAIQELETAVKLDPSFDGAKKDRKRLK